MDHHFVGQMHFYPNAYETRGHFVLTESGSRCCSKNAENSTNRNFGPAMDLPCQGGATSLCEVLGFVSRP